MFYQITVGGRARVVDRLIKKAYTFPRLLLLLSTRIITKEKLKNYLYKRRLVYIFI
jgi:hypothetical protein